MPRNLSAIYSSEWVKTFDGFEKEYEAIGLALHVLARNPSFTNDDCVVDLGCGPGHLLFELQSRGWYGTGYDGSSACLASAAARGIPKERLHLRDLLSESPLEHELPVDLAICTEVAEHIPFEGADRLVERFDTLGAPLMLWSSAPPGQGGHDHINEQPWIFWAEKFLARGIVEDVELTRAFLAPLRESIRGMTWVVDNSRILVRG